MTAGRALVLAPFLPEADRESGLRRLADQIDMLLTRGWEVTFGCLYPPRDRERYVRQLAQRGVEAHAPLESLEPLGDARRFDLALIATWYVAERFLPELRAASPDARIAVDSVDLHFVREIRQRLRAGEDAAPGQLELDHARRLTMELNNYNAADAVLTASEKEATLLNDLVRPDLALALPDCEEVPPSPTPLGERRGVLFIGNFRHPPNRDALAYLCEDIAPRLDPGLLAEHPISVVGTAAEEHLPAAMEGQPHVRTVGWVPSVVPYLHAARVSVVPLRYGAGTKRKLVQALMAGAPTVTTTVGAEGLDLRDGREVIIADDPETFAAAVEDVLRQPETAREMIRHGRAHALRLHGRATAERRFDEVLAEILARTPQPAVPRPAGASSVAVDPEYRRLVARVRRRVHETLPQDARVLVASRGDDELVGYEGRQGWHFPRAADGRYAGHHPADSDAAIAHLEELRAAGATHLLLPRTSFWWLEYYDRLRTHLESAYRRIHGDQDAVIYELAGNAAVPASRQSALVRFASGADHRTGAASSNGRPLERAAEISLTPEVVRALQPRVLPAAGRYRVDGRPRVLVLGIYLAGKPNTAAHVAAVVGSSEEVDVHQRWIALGDGAADGDLGALTTVRVTEPTPKYVLLNRLLAAEDLSDYDFVVTTDDDVVLPDGFLDRLLGIQASVGFDLAQPARTLNSHVDLPIVLQQRGVLARRTLFVEIGPVASFGREIYDLVFPFDETNPMGWGFEHVWSHRLRQTGRSQGIVDAVPVDHSIRKPVANYRWADAAADRESYLARNPHLPLEECFRVLDVVGVTE